MGYNAKYDPVIAPTVHTGFTARTTGLSWVPVLLPKNTGYVDMAMAADTRIICNNSGNTLSITTQPACPYRAATAPHRILVVGNDYLHYRIGSTTTGGTIEGTILSSPLS